MSWCAPMLLRLPRSRFPLHTPSFHSVGLLVFLNPFCRLRLPQQDLSADPQPILKSSGMLPPASANLSATHPHSRGNTATTVSLQFSRSRQHWNPIVLCFNCAPAGCWLVTQQAGVAYPREVNSEDWLICSYTCTHALVEHVQALREAVEKPCRANYTYSI